MVLRYRSGDILGFEGDLVLLGHFADARPLTGALGRFDWRNCAAVSRLWKAREGMFEFGRLSLVPSQGKIPAGGVLIAGLGRRREFNADLRKEIHRLGLEAAARMRARDVAAEALPAESDGPMNPVDDFGAALEKAGRGSFGSLILYVADPEILPSLRTGPEPEQPGERTAHAARG